ncbi:MAG: DUF5343 domain-containing protein [Parvibaculum sp.]|nr:DUF5343 domain-containing protein [Parvibaculum sp.]
MADYPPFMNSYGLVTKILAKVKEAKTPDRFTQDYLGSTLGFSSGSAKPFIPLLKRIGFLSSDGSPTELYKQFRNPDHSRSAMGKALRHGYADLYERNEKVHALDKKSLEGLIVQATGLDHGSTTLRSIVGTFENLKSFAAFDGLEIKPGKESGETGAEPPHRKMRDEIAEDQHIRLGLSYTINLVLPKTDDVSVFNAIFKALRENLLQK